jgi:hypothetical protein
MIDFWGLIVHIIYRYVLFVYAFSNGAPGVKLNFAPNGLQDRGAPFSSLS